jgi:hypothetical protein
MALDRVILIDKALVEVGWLQGVSNTPLAKNGNSDRRLIACEWGVVVGNERASGWSQTYRSRFSGAVWAAPQPSFNCFQRNSEK